MYPREDGSGLELRDYLRILARRKWAVIAAPLLVVAVAVTFSKVQTPIYAASAELLFQSSPSEAIFDPNYSLFAYYPERRLKNEVRVLRSSPIRDAVKAKLGQAPGIIASAIPETDAISLQAKSTDPETAANIVNAYASAYIEYRQQRAIDDLFSAAEKVQAKLNELQKQIDASPEQQKGELIDIQGVFREELERLQVNADLKTAGAQLVAPAGVPSDPISPRPLRNAISALAFGLVLGVGLAFFFEYLDDTVKDKDDLDKAAPGVPLLGLIPLAGNWKAKDAARTITLTDPNSPPAEAYRALRTSVQFMGLDKPVQAIQVTSPNAEEGKTTTLVNLAVVLARAGWRVVVICCDLRRPRVHEFLDLTNERGFTSVLLGECSTADALQRVPSQERLFVLASGPVPPNPSELLSTARVTQLIKSLKGERTIVLIDSPPLLPVTDALVLARQVDATLVVSAAGSTRRKELSRAIEMLRQVDAEIGGLVLNGVTSQSAYGYGYGYGYGATAPNGVANGNGKASKNDAAQREKPTNGRRRAKAGR